MKFSQVDFVVRIKETANLRDIGDRVGKLLNCQFVPSNDKDFEGHEAIEAKVLGLWLTIDYAVLDEENNMREYQLTGGIGRDLIRSHLGTIIDISDYILGIVVSKDSKDWYIPSKEDFLRESGILKQ
ncbi:MAG: hypothetical protein OHK0022_23620 [Roseiflexaceae bacterium]